MGNRRLIIVTLENTTINLAERPELLLAWLEKQKEIIHQEQ